MADPLARARRFHAKMDELRDSMATLADLRAEAVREALDSGMTRADVARQLGVTPQAVTKILQRP